VVVLAACLVLSFGRTTFGPLVDAIPGGSDIFFRRFMMGAQLAALLLAGTGAASVGGRIWSQLGRWAARRRLLRPRTTVGGGLARMTVTLAALILALAPAWLQLAGFDRRNSDAVSTQRRADATDGAEIDRLVAVIKRDGGGRVYAGAPTNWGAGFTVGAVPVFKYLETDDVDEVGYTLRTTSLMTDPEVFFDETNPADYTLFAIHYLVLPAGRRPPIAARPLMRAGQYSLWVTNTAGYVHVGEIVGTLSANRTNVGFSSIPLLHSSLALRAEYLRVSFARSATGRPELPLPSHAANVGSVISESDDLAQGWVTATVRMQKPGIVVLSASFDPGWHATLDGHQGATEMVAPALVATKVPAGTHTIVLRYQGFGGYLALFAVSGASLVLLLITDIMLRRRKQSSNGRVPRLSEHSEIPNLPAVHAAQVTAKPTGSTPREDVTALGADGRNAHSTARS
jgi:hypothetical protein